MRARLGDIALGPMATERGLRRHHDLLADARAHGARVEGGEDLGGGRLAPALVTGAGPGVRLVDEEPFTPVVAVLEVPDAAAAVAEANRPDYGLVGYVCGRDLRTALETAGRPALRHGGDQRLAGGGAPRALRGLARLRGGRRARAPGARGLRALAAPARPVLAATSLPAVHAARPDQLLQLRPRAAEPGSPTPPTTRCGSW